MYILHPVSSSVVNVPRSPYVSAFVGKGETVVIKRNASTSVNDNMLFLNFIVFSFLCLMQ